MLTFSSSPLFFDVETEPVRHDTAIPRPVVASYAVGSNPVRLASPEAMGGMVRAHPGPIVGHNVAFDLSVLGLDVQQNLYDTAIRATLQGARSGDPSAVDSSLERLAKQSGIYLLGKGTTQLSFRVGKSLTPEQEEYAKHDVVATRAVWEKQGNTDRCRDEERQTSFSLRVFRMAREGIRVDLPLVRGTSAQLNPRIFDLRGRLLAAGLIQARGPKKDPWRREAVSVEVVQNLLAKSGAIRRANPESELLASDEEALAASGIPELLTLVEYRATRKQQTMFDAFDTGEGDVVRAYWKSLVVTGRISCSRPNLTNIPRMGGLRECLLPDEGEVWIDADFPALELRTWAHVCQTWVGYSTLLETWKAGEDPHWRTAAAILRVSYAVAQTHARGAETRQLAKVLNFGLPGGMYPKRLRDHLRTKGFDIGLYGATRLRNDWLKTYPEAQAYFNHIDGMREGDKFRVALPGNGRERLCYQNDARNYPFQGLGSDVAKEALVLAQDAGLKVKALVHDQMLVSARPEHAQEVGNTLTKCMQLAGEKVCPGVPWEGIKFAVYPDRWISKPY